MGSASDQEQHRIVKTLKEGEMTLETVERTLQKDDKTVEGGGICPLLQWEVKSLRSGSDRSVFPEPAQYDDINGFASFT